jgi:hypothetical protein
MVGECFLHLNRFQFKKTFESQSKDMVFFYGQYSLLCSWNEIAVGFCSSLIRHVFLVQWGLEFLTCNLQTWIWPEISL